jgi:hypothetical protein
MNALSDQTESDRFALAAGRTAIPLSQRLSCLGEDCALGSLATIASCAPTFVMRPSHPSHAKRKPFGATRRKTRNRFPY